MLIVGLTSAAISLAAAFWFLAGRGVRRWLALAVLVLSPLAVVAVYAFASLLWVALASAAAWLLATAAARAALAPAPADWQMPEHRTEPRAVRPFLIMNPRSGGGKVAKFELKRKAEALGAEVFLMSGQEPVDVAQVARQAVARGADLLGVAGGDGTQALVAGVAAEHDIPFVVITAGTRNHFALDLGLDRENPAACLDALADGVDLCVDLGSIGGQIFVNNASFGAYAEVVETSAYRDDKLASTLDLLPDLLRGQRGTPLVMSAAGVRLDGPQAVLVANNPYGTGDVAGLSVLTAPEVTVDANATQVPVGIDGEAVSLPTPVQCSIRPAALRVRVPRHRPGVSPPKARLSWTQLRRLAVPGGRWSRGTHPVPQIPEVQRARQAYEIGLRAQC